MDRLTYSETREAIPRATIASVCHKLSDYEDSGLTPVECAQLREDNYLKRQSIQNLSCQIVQYQKVFSDIQKFFNNPEKYSGPWTEFYSAVIKQLLSNDIEANLKDVLNAVKRAYDEGWVPQEGGLCTTSGALEELFKSFDKWRGD
ncbi:MAG: hypothetical protein ABFD18_06345 [Syntrophomonas sp.]